MRFSKAIFLIGVAACAPSGGRAPDSRQSFHTILLHTGESPGGVEAADLNRDSRPDLVVTNQSGSVSIFLNRGGGHFVAPPGSPFAAGQEPNDVAIADFNGDGSPDLAFANHEAKSVTLLLGDGKGAFRPAPRSPIPVTSVPHPHGIAAADLDRDGAIDLVVDSFGTNQLELLRGDGKGDFAPWKSETVGRHPYQRPRTADVNKDGWPDLLTSNLESRDVTVLLGGKAGFKPAPGSPFSAGDAPFGLAAGDFNGDGRPDIVIVNSPGSSPPEQGRDGITILTGDGAGGFSKGPSLDTAPRPNRVATGDLDGDGLDDIVVSLPDSNRIDIFYSVRGAAPRRQAIDIGAGAKGVAIADLDGDGRRDIAVTLQGAAGLKLLLTGPARP